MSKLETVEAQILELSPEEYRALREWQDELEADRWDAQIEADAKAGRLDKFEELAERAVQDFRSGRYRKV